VHVSREHGYSLPELLIAMSVGLVVMFGTFVLVRTTMNLSTGVVRRTDAMQRGRLAMDRVTRQLRSQVCLDTSTPAIAAADASSVTFYADLSSGTNAPARHTLAFDPAARRLKETRYQGTAAAPGGTVTFPSAPTRELVLLESVVAAPSKPVFSYFAYTTSGPPRTATVPLAVPLSAADRAKVARIAVDFVVQPSSTKDTSASFEVSEQITVRHADPNAVSPTPTCS
jgi:hypothetical protein